MMIIRRDLQIDKSQKPSWLGSVLCAPWYGAGQWGGGDDGGGWWCCCCHGCGCGGAAIVNLIYCSITVNHRLTGPGIMVKLCLLFVGKSTNNNAIDIPNC
jgi:hypothetical protein